MNSAVVRPSGPEEPIRVFVGADDSQMVAARVLEFSIRRHATRPVSVTIMRDLPVPVPRDRRNRPRTGFSFYRFLIPALCHHQGRALYLDADMLVFGDMAELWDIPFGASTVLCTYQSEMPGFWPSGAPVELGRQLSVMLLDCARLDWDVEAVVRGLDQGRYTYSQLMSELCIVPAGQIADAIPPDWNRLESYEAGKTKLLHYTVVATQPWKTTENPLRGLWLTVYREALEAGALAPAEVTEGIEAGFLHPSLADDLPGVVPSEVARQLSRERAAAAAARRTAMESEERVADLEAALTDLRGSWTWRIGRLVTGPLGRLARLLRTAGLRR